MKLAHVVARPLLAAIFLSGGVDTFRNPEPRAKLAAPVLERVTKAVPLLPQDPVELVRLNAAAQVTAAALMAVGAFPRLAALTLAGSIVPTTFGGHRFWEYEDAPQRGQQRTHFLKNAAILGGLLVVALG
jgi:uncharacterized membrane protein YphA (DoxX/SURF4 family)